VCIAFALRQVVLSYLCAVLIDGIDSIFGLLGSTTSALVCFILPPAFYLKLFPGPLLSRKKLPAALLLVTGVVLMIAGTYVSVWTLLYGSGP
jgi:amino acid permease